LRQGSLPNRPLCDRIVEFASSVGFIRLPGLFIIAQRVTREPSQFSLCPLKLRPAREPKMQQVAKPFQIATVLLVLTAALAGVGGNAFADIGLLAQAPTPAPVTNVVSGRSFTVEIGIVVVMFGGALFAVCRSSNRT
jgi:hypothetical protein